MDTLVQDVCTSATSDHLSQQLSMFNTGLTNKLQLAGADLTVLKPQCCRFIPCYSWLCPKWRILGILAHVFCSKFGE